MLVFSAYIDQCFSIGEVVIALKSIDIKANTIVLEIDAPSNTSVQMGEVYSRIQRNLPQEPHSPIDDEE